MTDVSKQTVVLLLIFAVILSIVATWKVLVNAPNTIYPDALQEGDSNSYLEDQGDKSHIEQPPEGKENNKAPIPTEKK